MAALPPLPEGWEERRDQQGNAYYVDHVSRQTSWQHPLLQAQPAPTDTPPSVLQPATATTNNRAGANFFNRSANHKPPVGMAESTSALDHKDGNTPASPRRRSTLPVPSPGGGGGAGAGGAAAVDKSATFAPHLIPDDDRSKCAVCGERFAALRRRHHCRCCGEVVCATCSPTKHLMKISEPGYERPRRACQPCAAHLSAGDNSCPARYAVAIATPGADMYHKQEAVRHLSTAMEAAAKNTVKPGGGGGSRIVGPLAAIQRVHGGPRAVFEALVPMMSTEVPLDVCAYACQLLGASLFVASRIGSPEKWAALASVVPEEGIDGLLECLRVVPARAKAARALFYAAKAPLAGGTGGELVESRGGVTIMLEVLETLPLTPPAGAAGADIKGLRVWLCATLQPVIADRPRAVQAFMASRGIPLLCRQLVAGPADIALHACGVIASALRRSSTGGGGGGGSGAVPGSVIEAVDADIIAPLLGMLAGGNNKDTHASALAMELLVILASHPPCFDRLRSAGTIPAVAACLEDPSGGSAAAAATGARASLMQLALIVLSSFLRGGGGGGDGDSSSSDDVAAEIALTKAHVRVLSLLSASDPKLRFPAAELVLQLSRRCRRAPARAIPAAAAAAAAGRPPDIAKDIIEAGGLRALWAVCSDPSPMARPVALEALAVMLGTAAAMSRSTASSEAVLALVSQDAVGKLVREHVDPALAVLGGRDADGATAPPDNVAAVATSALLALHFIACNPDPAVYGLFVAAAGVDEHGRGGGGGGGGGSSSAWSLILSSVETGADGRAGPAFLEAALLAAGSVCGAPPLPVLGSSDGTGATATARSAADETARILPTYQARAETADCLVAAASATARGLATRAVALIDGGGGSVAFSSNGAGYGYGAAELVSAKLSRAAIRVVWSLARGPSSATLAAHGTLPRLMDRTSSSRRQGSGGGSAGLRRDSATGVLVLDTMAAFLSLEEGGGDGDSGDRGLATAAAVPASSRTPLSPSSASTLSRTVEELCELVLDGTAQGSMVPQEDGTAPPTGTDSLGPRSLELLATAAANPRLRPLLVDSPKFPAVLDLLMMERHLDGASSSSLQVALGALSVVRAAVSDKSTALRLVKLGIVSKLAALVRQKPAGPPPPLPPRRRLGSGAGGSGAGGEQKPPGEAAPAPPAVPPRSEPTGRREEVCAALRVLAGLAEHQACVTLVLEKEDLGFLLQVVREGTTLPPNAGGSCQVKAEMREEVEDALLCLLPLTAHRQRGSLLNRALGLVATSPGHPGLDALLHLASAEGGTALQIVFQMVAADTAKSVPSSPILRPLGNGRHAAVLERLLGPVPFAWQGERGSSKHDSVVKAARARACAALRHACKEQSFSPASAAAAARDEDQDAGAAGGSGGGGGSGAEASSGTANSGEDDGSGVDGIIARLFPLVLSMAGTTVEGARCLCALFAGEGGVGEAARAAVLLPPGAGGGEAAAAAGGIRAVVGLLKSEQIEIRASGASILRRLIFAAASSDQQTTNASGRDTSAASPSCRALLASLHASGGRSEAVRSLSSLGLFGGGAGGTDDEDGRGGGGGGGSGGGSRGWSSVREKVATGGSRRGTAREARCRRQLIDDAAAVLVAMVGAVTSATVAAAKAASAAVNSGSGRGGGGGGGGGSWRHRRRGSGGSGGAGSALSDATGCGGMEGFDSRESEALSVVCADALRALATDAFTGPLEKARCLTLLADLAVDPRCARTLFRGGAIPQMLLNAQGCTHVELIDVYGGGGGTTAAAAAPTAGGNSPTAGGNSGFGGSDGRVSPALSATSCESEARSRTATEDLDAEQEDEEQQHEAVPAIAAAAAAVGDPSEVACCRCRQAMRLLARLVRGLPGETPAVVVRHSGLRSIVQILEDGAAEAAALADPAADGGGCGLPAATEAAVREALELFVALAEQAPHRRALVSTPGLLHSASSYVVSTTKSAASSSCSSSRADSAEAAAFRLLGNLAYSDSTRRRITQLDGLVLATARALSTSAKGLAARPSPPTVDAAVAAGGDAPPWRVSSSSSAVGLGEAAATLLGRLTPVLGVEGGEDELVAAGEALSAAVAAVSKATGSGGGGATQAAGVDDGRLLELASESLSGLLVLSWSDSGSLDVAAAVDSFVTDSSLADGVVALWQRATTAAAAASSPADFGTLPASSLALMSSIACRPTGRQALVAAGVASAVVDVALRPGGGLGHLSSAADDDESDGGLQLTVAERSEVIRLLCVLCASPAHRVAVRSSLIEATARERRGDGGGGGGGGGSDGAGDNSEDEFEVESDEAAVEAAIVRIQGSGGSGGSGFGSQDCRAGACRLAFLLGVAAPAPTPSRRLPHQGTAAGAGAFAADHLAAPVPAGGRRGPPQPPLAAEVQRSPTAATARAASPTRPAISGTTRSAFSARSGGGGAGGGGWAGTASRLEDDAASVDSQELEEALFPTTTTTTEASAVSSRPPRAAAAAAAARQESSALPSLPRIPTAAAAASAPAPAPSWRPLPPAPAAAPTTTRSDSEESLHRLLSIIAKAEGEDSAAATHPGAVGVQTVIPEERRRFESRGAGGGLYGSGGGGGGGEGGSAAGEDKTQCKTCGKLVFAPAGFDLALIDCPHCGQSMG